MSVLVSLFFSLVLTSFVGFSIPIILAIVLLGGLSLVSHLDVVAIWMAVWADIAYVHICGFLAVFGEGSTWNGIMMIAIVSAIAGLIFESFNFYRYQLLIDQNISSSCLQRQKILDMLSKLLNRSSSD